MLPSNQGVTGRKGRRERAQEETMELERLEFCLLLLTGEQGRLINLQGRVPMGVSLESKRLEA